MRQQRQLDLLKDYDCEICYHPGKTNVVADTLICKERANPRRAKELTMIIQSNLAAKIQDAQ